MSFTRDQAKAYVKSQLPAYLRQHGINPDSKKNFQCLNPEHNDGTPSMSYDSRRQKCHCFGCGADYDIFDLIKIENHLPDDAAAFKYAYELYGVELEKQPSSLQAPAAPAASSNQSEGHPIGWDDTIGRKEPEKPAADYRAYYKECAARRGQLTYLSLRGISEETAKAAALGYDMHFTTGTGGKVWQALIIPTGPDSYVARNTDTGAAKSDRYRKTGTSRLYMLDRLGADSGVFIVEGELDALSIVEAGGQAVALGSTANVQHLLDYLEKNPGKRPKQPLLLYLDNDDAGRNADKQLCEGLRKLGMKYLHYDPAEGLKAKDANEALMKEPQKFRQAVAKAANVDELAREKALAKYEQNSAANHIQEFLNGIAASVNTPCITTGFPALDKSLDGGLYEGLYIIGAISSLGKTTFIMQLADQAAALAGTDVLIFSLEMARSELMAKSISRLTLTACMEGGNGETRNAKTVRGITDGKRWANYSTAEKQLITSSVQEYGKIAKHIYITEGLGNIGVQQVRETVKQHVELTGRRPIVIIDYVQILDPADTHATDKQNTDKAVLELKRISRDFKLPLIGISSFNRDNYKTEATFTAFKESGALEYSSDVLLALQLEGAGRKDFNDAKEKKKNPRNVELLVLKNRNGRVGDKIKYLYYPMFNTFMEQGLIVDKKETK